MSLGDTVVGMSGRVVDPGAIVCACGPRERVTDWRPKSLRVRGAIELGGNGRGEAASGVVVEGGTVVVISAGAVGIVERLPR